ncbi:hypothetical protein Corgl_0251 [Coriobacterium glomerans PW2]|uniref:Uncharacterized protein n=1 Tax=Coriobacterium glomerans (strain ATCC 49209 / DSM 20642 / JCM 10262 / PW2) TaxID=700015 RepID=F2N738_CORGP|nr:hypothetical protein [Coriobacterium glomerans]AEB06377.1 hypothetical protein Corgl_0251 [Coriobacterium glomerans PW2]
MKELLKADLYRMTRMTKLHGYLWRALIIDGIVIAGFVFLLISKGDGR